MPATVRILVVAAALLAGCLGSPGAPPSPPAGDPPPDFGSLTIGLEEVLAGVESPVFATHAGDGSGRLFVVEQAGRIRTARGGALDAQPFLDIRGLVASGGERGLLGLAFPPDHETTRRFYVHYTRLEDGDSVLARYRAGSSGVGDPETAEVLLVVDQPYPNHNGGSLAFGPDGFLYFALGDGGSGGDPHGNGQRLDTHLGKILRIDVATGSGYAVPEGNPFRARADARPEVWAYGLRNPWRISFDRETGDLWIGDVGQNRMEEIDFQPRSSDGGENYGWNVWEGSDRHRPGDAAGAVAPVAEYEHGSGRCSVTGGYVYRGAAQAALKGVYLYGDYCSGEVWGLVGSNGSWQSRLLASTDPSISSFGEDEAGEVLLVDHGGRVYRVVAK